MQTKSPQRYILNPYQQLNHRILQLNINICINLQKKKNPNQTLSTFEFPRVIINTSKQKYLLGTLAAISLKPKRFSQSPCPSRRLVCQYPTKFHVERDINNIKLRSLLVLDCYGESWMLSGSSFKRLELLRVLDLYKPEFQGGRLPSGIGKLIHLKYLRLG